MEHKSAEVVCILERKGLSSQLSISIFWESRISIQFDIDACHTCFEDRDAYVL